MEASERGQTSRVISHTRSNVEIANANRSVLKENPPVHMRVLNDFKKQSARRQRASPE